VSDTSRVSEASRASETSRTSGTPRVSFVIPVRNDPVRLKNCLATIERCEYPRAFVEVVVADNGSIDDTPAVATAAGAKVLSLPGIAVGEMRNRGARAAQGDVLAFVDADHELGPGWIGSAIATLRLPGVTAAGAPYLQPPNATWVQRCYDSFRDHSEGVFDTPWLGSGNLAIWRQAFLDAGGFDTTLETCEDVDLCQRLRRQGHTLKSDSGMRSVHMGDPKTLRAIFWGELWRGRDNLRVSFRGPLTPRDLPSVVIPVLTLLLLAAAVLALLTTPWTGLRGGAVALTALLGCAGLSALRALRMLRNLRGGGPLDVVRAWLVAASYDLGRALSLVIRVRHGVRRRG
jgi:GT2 family glycosyltransferase